MPAADQTSDERLAQWLLNESNQPAVSALESAVRTEYLGQRVSALLEVCSAPTNAAVIYTDWFVLY